MKRLIRLGAIISGNALFVMASIGLTVLGVSMASKFDTATAGILVGSLLLGLPILTVLRLKG